MTEQSELLFDRIPLTGSRPLGSYPDPLASLPSIRQPMVIAATPAPPKPPEPVKAPPVVEAAAPIAAVETPPPPAPAPKWVREAVANLLKPTKQKAFAMMTAGGLLVGAVALNGYFGGSAQPSPTPAAQQPPAPEPAIAQQTQALQPMVAATTPDPRAEAESPPTPSAPVAPVVPFAFEPIRIDPAKALAIPELVTPKAPAAPARLPEIIAITPTPTVVLEVAPPTIIPAAASDPFVLPSLPTIPSPVPTPVPVVPGAPAILKVELPASPPTIPVLPGAIDPKVALPAPGPIVFLEPPAIPTTPPAPTPVVPTPVPVVPSAPTPVIPTTPAPTPVVPITPAPTPIVPMPDPFPPVAPVAPMPKTDWPSPPSAGVLTLSKPPGGESVPAAALSAPRTDYDVDLHDPKPKDTYDAISKQHYGDAKYAAALKAFNRNLDLGQGVAVQVPPIYVLRKLGTSATVRPANAERGLEWTQPAVVK